MGVEAALGAAAVAVAIAAMVVLARERAHTREKEHLQTELSRANAKLAERSSLAAVGEMVSGLAQELKTPLQEALGNAELMLAHSGTTSVAESSEELRQIRDGVERAAGIVRNLVAFAETGSLSCRWHDVNDVVRRAIDSSRHDLGGISVECDTVERLPMVYVDGRQLEKVIAALLARAAHTAAGRNGRTAALKVAISAARVGKPDDHVVVTIVDNGPPSEVGQAASLAAARRVIEAHRGTLTVAPLEAAPGVRATIALPIAAASDSDRSSQEKPRSWTESSISSTSIANGTSTS